MQQGKNQYAEITVEYKKSKMLPFRTESETPTFMKLLGSNLGSLEIIDYACGEGFYTRKIKEHTIGKVTGVDISPEMIDLAKR
jgi:ubiquinone/menaquinone biosynthesis C-methylase UbiE